MFECRVSNIKNNVVFVLHLIPILVLFFFREKVSVFLSNNVAEKVGSLPMDKAVILGLIFLASLSCLYYAIGVLINYCTIYRFEDERLIYEHGVLNKRKEYLEFFRIKDLSVYQPFYYRPFGIENVILVTTDRTHPKFKMSGIENFSDNEKELRELVKKANNSSKSELDIV